MSNEYTTQYGSGVGNVNESGHQQKGGLMQGLKEGMQKVKENVSGNKDKHRSDNTYGSEGRQAYGSDNLNSGLGVGNTTGYGAEGQQAFGSDNTGTQGYSSGLTGTGTQGYSSGLTDTGAAGGVGGYNSGNTDGLSGGVGQAYSSGQGYPSDNLQSSYGEGVQSTGLAGQGGLGNQGLGNQGVLGNQGRGSQF